MKLRNKFMSLLLPAGALTALLILFLIRRSVHAVIVDQLAKSATLLAEAAAADATPGFESRSETLLLPILQSIQKREGALYAAALDSSGRTLAHTTITEKGKIAEGALGDGPAVRMLDFRDEPVLEVSVPVWSLQAPPSGAGLGFLMSGEAPPLSRRRLGFLRVGLSLQPALRTEERILRDVILIVGAIGAAALLLVLALVGGILRPVNGLMEGIDRIRRGRYDVDVPILSDDELGDLARSFNDMCRELVLSTVSKEYVEGIIENISDPVFVAGAGGSIETANRAALETLGRSGAELIGRPLSVLFDGAQDAVQGELEASLAAGPIRDRKVNLKTKDGRLVPAIFSASALADLRDRQQGCVCIAKDITELKRTEEELRSAKTAAEAVSKELEAFSYSVSHDLRAPLRGIAGFSQIVLEDAGAALDASSREHLVRVVDGTKLMGRLIDDILELSRVSRTEMTRRSVDLSEIARGVAASLREASPSRRAEVVVADGLAADGDPNLLRVALVNLIGNAWKYTGRKTDARIEVGSFLDGAGARTFFVKDNGAGFDMAYSAKLFGAFQRLHAQAEFDGTGVGLATVQRIIRRHGGKIWAESSVGYGATFYFTL